jgi:hypothetical protein
VSQGRAPLSQTESAKESGHYPREGLPQVVAADELAGAVLARAKRWSRRPPAKSYATYLNSQCSPEGYLAHDLLGFILEPRQVVVPMSQ